MHATPQELWLGFTALVTVLLVLDLAVLNRLIPVLSLRQATIWSAFLVTCALAFGGVLVVVAGVRPGLEYFTGYVIELSLSVDNLLVFLMIFEYFAVPAAMRPRALKWGILGAIALRGLMIAAGTLLLQRFTWVLYVFGAVLVYTGWKMFREADVRIEPERNPVVRLARRIMPLSPSYDGDRFFTHSHRGWLATPLFLVLIVIDWFDLVFAIDSIPAIFAVTRDPFIVLSSNVFAVLGLRALFFVLAGLLDRWRYLKPAVALVLVFVGAKMLAEPWLHLPIAASLGVVVGTLGVAILLSLRAPRPDAANDRVSGSPSA